MIADYLHLELLFKKKKSEANPKNQLSSPEQKENGQNSLDLDYFQLRMINVFKDVFEKQQLSLLMEKPKMSIA